VSAAKRRAKAVARRQWVRDLLIDHGMRKFFETGRIPAGITAFSQCFCGARAITFEDDTTYFNREFDDAHAYCEAYP